MTKATRPFSVPIQKARQTLSWQYPSKIIPTVSGWAKRAKTFFARRRAARIAATIICFVLLVALFATLLGHLLLWTIDKVLDLVFGADDAANTPASHEIHPPRPENPLLCIEITKSVSH